MRPNSLRKGYHRSHRKWNDRAGPDAQYAGVAQQGNLPLDERRRDLFPNPDSYLRLVTTYLMEYAEDCGTFLQKYEDRHKNISAFTEEQVLKNLSKIKEFAKSGHKEEIRAMVQQYVNRVFFMTEWK